MAFDDVKIKKDEFYYSEQSIDINDVDSVKIVISGIVQFGEKGFKYFIGYKDDDKINLLCIIVPKVSEYVK